jgi:hypothetical protein
VALFGGVLEVGAAAAPDERNNTKDALGREHEPAGTPLGGTRGTASGESVFSAEEIQALKDYHKGHEALNAALKERKLTPGLKVGFAENPIFDQTVEDKTDQENLGFADNPRFKQQP